MTPRRKLVTAALPYANGHIHLGHLVEYIQTDIWVRFQKLRGHRCIYICADDTHGTAIMIRARQEGRSEEALIADMSAAHQKDFAGFDVAFDHYGSTNSAHNKRLCHEFWTAIRAAGLVKEAEVEQLYDPQAGTFLADRFVKGGCPKCQEPDQFGDSCEKCGATFSPTELLNPKSTLTGTTPELRKAKHLFIVLEKLHAFLEEWSQSGDHLQPEVANFLKENFLKDPLRDWDISRPAPYFGFEIPDSPGNYWYVWFDAPVGYLASTADWCDKTGEDFKTWWKNPETEVHHFIGKDIQYFHTLFWPAMLKTVGYNLPTRVHIHGHLTVNGKKMSKRDGTYIRASTFAEHLDAAYLRYYYATKLGPRVDDLDLNLKEFADRIDSDLVGKVVNLASRTARFVKATGLSAKYPDDGGLFAEAAAEAEAIAASYEAGDYNKAMRQIMALADKANQYIDREAPWKLKDPSQAAQLQDVCTVALNLFRQLTVYLSPVLPRLAQQTGELLGKPIVGWDEIAGPLVGTPVGEFKHLLARVDRKKIDTMIAASREGDPVVTQAAAATSASDSDGPEALAAEPLAPEITFDEFAKVDLRVARVIAAEEVPEAKKLLKLTLSLGGDERRQVFAGIKGVYDPASLVGQLVVCAANLAPKQMKFGTSQGMVVAAGPGGKDIFLLRPDVGAKPGQRVH